MLPDRLTVENLAKKKKNHDVDLPIQEMIVTALKCRKSVENRMSK